MGDCRRGRSLSKDAVRKAAAGGLGRGGGGIPVGGPEVARAGWTWEQHKYAAVNISWPCNALNKQAAWSSSESSQMHCRQHARRHACRQTHTRRSAHTYRHVNTYAPLRHTRLPRLRQRMEKITVYINNGIPNSQTLLKVPPTLQFSPSCFCLASFFFFCSLSLTPTVPLPLTLSLSLSFSLFMHGPFISEGGRTQRCKRNDLFVVAASACEHGVTQQGVQIKCLCVWFERSSRYSRW